MFLKEPSHRIVEYLPAKLHRCPLHGGPSEMTIYLHIEGQWSVEVEELEVMLLSRLSYSEL